jgi:hypothetical protein
MFFAPTPTRTLAWPVAWVLQALQAGGLPLARGTACKPGFADTRPMAAEPVYGCGWFDSSHDLMQGLVVQEGIIVTDAAYPACR